MKKLLLYLDKSRHKNEGDVAPGKGGKDLQQLLQLAALAAETVQGPILSKAIDPLPSWGDPAAHKVSALPLTGLECLHYLKAHADFLKIACQFCGM